MSDELDVSGLTKRHTYAFWRAQAPWKPVAIERAEGCYFWSDTGKRFLDLSSQLMCSNLGHQNQAVVEAICRQARDLAFISPTFACETRARAVVKLMEVMPPGIDKFLFMTSGAEANEAAMKIARLVTGKHKIISRYSSYHGATAAAMSVTGDIRRWWSEPSSSLPGTLHAPVVNCYRCPLGRTYPECGIACVEYIEYMLEQERNVAAAIVEPIVGADGVLVPPREYMPRLAEICRRRGVLLICDEVMSGWGRTGKWFAVEHWGVVPDILVTAKGITGGVIPLSVCATSRAIADHFEENYFAHGTTYQAHPMGLAPMIAAIDEYRRLNLLERATVQGEKLGARLRALAERHPSVGDVRGIGLFWAIDLVRDRKTKAPLTTIEDRLARRPLPNDKVSAELMKRGVYCAVWLSHLIIAPPLIIEDAHIDEAIEALDAALTVADSHLGQV